MAYLYRVIRLCVYFIVGLMLGACAVMAHAETIPATAAPPVAKVNWYWNASTGLGGTSPGAQLCGGSYPNFGEPGLRGCGNGGCFQGNPATSGGTCISGPTQVCPSGTVAITSGPNAGMCQVPGGLSCPAGGNWTLSGSSCTRPDCRPDQERDGSGVCTCPAGKTNIGEMCVTLCPTGYHVLTPDNGQCEKDCWGDQRQATDGHCECAKGSKNYFSGTQAQTVALQGGGDCMNGCSVSAGAFSIPLGALGAATGGSVSQWLTPTSTTGSACQGAATTGTVKATLPPPAPVPPPTPEQPADPKTTPKNNASPDDCASSGGVYMTVGGQGKCATPGPDNASDAQKLTSGKKESTQTNPDGSKVITTEESVTTTNPYTGENGTTTKKSERKIGPNGEDLGTTTTEAKGSGDKGGKNGDGSKGFCEENPQSPICKKSSWSGDCDNAPVCDGDAVQCATAKAVWEHRCVNKWAEKDNDLSNGIDKEHLFGDQAKIDAALNKDGTKDFDILATFQAKRQNYLTFASSCNPDLSFDFKGTHYQFDTTILCQLGLVIKILLHLAAYMALIRILTVKLF